MFSFLSSLQEDITWHSNKYTCMSPCFGGSGHRAGIIRFNGENVSQCNVSECIVLYSWNPLYKL